jgi:hypothetical protein
VKDENGRRDRERYSRGRQSGERQQEDISPEAKLEKEKARSERRRDQEVLRAKKGRRLVSRTGITGMRAACLEKWVK